MSSHQTRKLKTVALWAGILLAGIAVGAFSQRSQGRVLLGRLRDDAVRSALVFDTAELRALRGQPDDVRLPAYSSVQGRLRKLKAIDAQVRSVFILRDDRATGTFVLLADSGEPAAGRGPRTDNELPAAAISPALQELLRAGRPASDGPVSDPHGVSATGYAVIAETPPERSATPVREILGLEVDASGWRQQVWIAGFQGAFFVWIMLGLPVVAWMAARRQLEQREVIRNLSEAMEQSHSAILIVDLESRIEYANRGLCQQIGYQRRELLGRKWRDFHGQHGGEEVLSEMVATVRAGRPWEGEWTNKRKDNTLYPVRGIVTPVRHRNGTLSCFVAVFDDVTETKRREAELREARDAALAGDRAKGQFLATMSHEVRTPLNGIVGFTSLLLETPMTSEQREYVQTIRVSTEALIQLTGDILDFARIESGKLKLDPLACDPRECIEDALDLLAAKAAEKQIELLHRVAPDVPAAVLADGGRLRQVLVNLIGNAVKFTDKGEVLVSVRVVPEEGNVAEAGQTATADVGPAGSTPPPPCVLEFAIRDTGIGIAAENHAKLFRPFSQVDESTTRRYGGTGLGLAICRNLVDLMGGGIQVTSESGRGSTFTFTIRAGVAVLRQPDRDLGGLRLGLAMSPGALRAELAELLRGWHAELVEADIPENLAPERCELVLVEASHDTALELAAQDPHHPLPPDKTLGIVPVSLPNDLRTAMRARFRLLVNKPVHHDALFELLSGRRERGVVRSSRQFGFRVLAVEDNAINQRLMQKMLTNLGCTCTLRENGREALETLKEHATDFDLVVLDLHMPELDGMAALREIRSGKVGARPQTTWIIAVTADAREEQRARALDAGVNDYLAKPVQLADLEAALLRFRNEQTARFRV